MEITLKLFEDFDDESNNGLTSLAHLLGTYESESSYEPIVKMELKNWNEIKEMKWN